MALLSQPITNRFLELLLESWAGIALIAAISTAIASATAAMLPFQIASQAATLAQIPTALAPCTQQTPNLFLYYPPRLPWCYGASPSVLSDRGADGRETDWCSRLRLRPLPHPATKTAVLVYASA
jgi:hypothetical protein